MKEENSYKKSKLVAVLREGVAVVQMVLFKELRSLFASKYQDKAPMSRSMLAGAIVNKLFGTENPEEKFQNFNTENKAVIEQELLSLAEQFPQLRFNITDALRIQILCDNHEGNNSADILLQVEEIGILVKGREIPLPSTFMTLIRKLGEDHGLTVAPAQISSDDDNSLVH